MKQLFRQASLPKCSEKNSSELDYIVPEEQELFCETAVSSYLQETPMYILYTDSYFAFYILNIYTKIYANHVKANDEQQIVAFQKFLKRV